MRAQQLLGLLQHGESEMGVTDGDLRPLQLEDAHSHLVQRRLGIGQINVVVGDHQAEHFPLAAERFIGGGIGIPQGRSLGQTGQQRRLGQGQIGGRLVEIGIGRRLDAVGQVAVIDLVQI